MLSLIIMSYKVAVSCGLFVCCLSGYDFVLSIAATEVPSGGRRSDIWLWQPVDRGHFPVCHSSFLPTHVSACRYWIVAGCRRRWAWALQPNISIFFIPCRSQASLILQSFLGVSEQEELLGYFSWPHNSLESIPLCIPSSDHPCFCLTGLSLAAPFEDIYAGLWGFNSSLACIAIGGMFMALTWQTHLLALACGEYPTYGVGAHM